MLENTWIDKQFLPNAATALLLPRFLVQVILKVQVDFLQLCPRPKVLAKELQAGFDAGVDIKALQLQHVEQPVPTIVIDQTDKQFLQRYAMEGVVHLGI